MKIDQASEPGTIMDVLIEAIKREQESYDYYYRAALQAAKPATRKNVTYPCGMGKGTYR